MYIQITTRCQMSCSHCCYSCTADGDDMKDNVFSRALELCSQFGSYVCIGGGEPTLHPRFKSFMFDAMALDEETCIITNGGITKLSLAIAQLTQKNVILGILSRDEFHDEIDEEVVDAFSNMNGDHNYNIIRDTSQGGTKEALPHGRAKKLLEWDIQSDVRTEDHCPCPEPMIKPDGIILQCGCEDAPMVGNVYDGISGENTAFGYCHLSDEFLSTA